MLTNMACCMLSKIDLGVSIYQVDPKEHYARNVGPIEHTELEECPIDIKNIGWTLGNDCPYRCTHCYSMVAREKGMNLSERIIDRVVSELSLNKVETVNLGGNEPIFTNGPNPKNTLLPYIIDNLTDRNIRVGLTTSGISLLQLEKNNNASFSKLNDVDVSLDSPYEQEHNQNRGAELYYDAIKALELCKKHGIDHTIIMCSMNWNFTKDRILALVNLSKTYGANIRINPMKPVEPKHMSIVLKPEQYYEGFSALMELCDQIDLGEPPLAAVTNYSNAKGCPCGRTSFRIHSITPDGKIPVSPCVYLHDYKTGDLIVDDLYDIIRSDQFKTFRRRVAHPEMIPGCNGCLMLKKCRGGCAARSYLDNAHKNGERSLFVKDPFCPVDINPSHGFPQNPTLSSDIHLVHMDYLCTWIGKPK